LPPSIPFQLNHLASHSDFHGKGIVAQVLQKARPSHFGRVRHQNLRTSRMPSPSRCKRRYSSLTSRRAGQWPLRRGRYSAQCPRACAAGQRHVRASPAWHRRSGEKPVSNAWRCSRIGRAARQQ
jgi:hypothetical protein